jgi:hypothetical protein
MTISDSQIPLAMEPYITTIAVRTAIDMAEATEDRSERADYIARARGAVVTMREKLGDGYEPATRVATMLTERIDDAQARLMQ